MSVRWSTTNKKHIIDCHVQTCMVPEDKSYWQIFIPCFITFAVLNEISAFGWMAMKSGRDTCGPHRSKGWLGDPLTFKNVLYNTLVYDQISSKWITFLSASAVRLGEKLRVEPLRILSLCTEKVNMRQGYMAKMFALVYNHLKKEFLCFLIILE